MQINVPRHRRVSIGAMQSPASAPCAARRDAVSRQALMDDILLTFNMGSSSLRVAVFAADAPDTPLYRLRVTLATGEVEGEGAVPAELAGFEPNTDPAELAALVAGQAAGPGQRIAAVAHRVVHGGDRQEPCRIDDDLLAELQDLEALCPLCQPPALEAIFHLRELWPELPQYAVFDTAFHRSQPALATTYALPAALRRQGIAAYGFHGISCQHVLRTLARVHPEMAAGRVLVAHLGNTASLTAVQGGRSVASSMGFSPLDGLPMGSRCGQIDPGVLLYLLDLGWSKSRLTDLLYHQSGLLGLSGIAGDLRELLAHEDEAAQFAVQYFCYCAARAAASLACAMEGVETLVFTGGIGEQAAAVREQICRRLGWLGVEVDAEANRAGSGSIDVSSSTVRVLVLPCDEETEMSRQCQDFLRADLDAALAEMPAPVAAAFALPR
jgi:acetate kinase